MKGNGIADRIQVEADIWFHVAITWSRSHLLRVYLAANEVKIVDRLYMTPGPRPSGTGSDSMFIGAQPGSTSQYRG